MTQHYQDNLGVWHELDDPAYEYLLTQNQPSLTFTAKTQAEYDAAIAPKPPTPQEQRDAISNAIQKMLEDLAKAHEYDSIDSTAKYIGFPNEFQVEATKLAAYAASCWAEAKVIRSEVLAGSPLPTVVQALARMPVY